MFGTSVPNRDPTQKKEKQFFYEFGTDVMSISINIPRTSIFDRL